MLLGLGKTSTEHEVPQRRCHPEPRLLPPEVVLVVVLLQLVEPPLLVVRRIDVVQGVVRHVVTQVKKKKENPVEGEEQGVLDRYQPCHEGASDEEGNYPQGRRIHQSVPKSKHQYGSLGSMW